MRIAIVGTRGIPNHYGGFEQFAEYLSQYLVTKGHEVYVYCSSLHPYKLSDFKGVQLIYKFDVEDKIGTAGQFLYDLNCILDSRKRKFDIFLQLGYTSSSIWMDLIPKSSVVITNMDGLEWKRSKYNFAVKKFLEFSEAIAARKSDILIADSLGIQSYLKSKYNLNSTYIPYGAIGIEPSNLRDEALRDFKLTRQGYDILIARMEPENNIEMILDGFSESISKRNFIVVGNVNSTKYGKTIYNKYKKDSRIKFVGAIYNINKLNTLRHFSNLYFHGHSVGGTNPSLLEAMASGCVICAHNNEFNSAILKETGFYFNNKTEISSLCETEISSNSRRAITTTYMQDIKEKYHWDRINCLYEEIFISALKGRA